MGGRRFTIVILSTLMLVHSVVGSTRLAAASEQPHLTHVIEDLLIEGVEVGAFASRSYGRMAQELLTGELKPAALRAHAALLAVQATPVNERVHQGTKRHDEVAYQAALDEASAQVNSAQQNFTNSNADSAAGKTDLVGALDAVTSVLASAPESAGYRPKLVSAQSSLQRGVEFIDQVMRKLSATNEALAAARGDISNAQTTAADDPSYADAVSAALSNVAGTVEPTSWATEAIGDATGNGDRASYALGAAAQSEEMPQDLRDATLDAQLLVGDGLGALSGAQSSIGDAQPVIDGARANLETAQSAGQPEPYASLTEAYRADVLAAQELTGVSLLTATEATNIVDDAILALEKAIADLGEVDVPDLDVMAAVTMLQTRLQGILAGFADLTVRIDRITDGLERAAAAIAGITQAELYLQKSPIEASIASFDIMYNATFPEGNDTLEISFDGTNAALRLADNGLMLIGGGVESAVVAVDQVHYQQEGYAWQSFDETPAGEGYRQRGDCRTETQHFDAFTVRTHYGGGGDDWCAGNEGRDVFWMRDGTDYAGGRGSDDQLHMGSGRSDEGRGDDGHDQLHGGWGSDSLYGSYGADEIFDKSEGSDDADYLSGGPGSDFANMKDGDVRDQFFGGDGNDPEPAFDRNCDVSRYGSGCGYDYFYSAGGHSQFPPEP